MNRELISRILTLVAMVTQGAILDWYLIYYNGSSSAPWVIADVVTVIVVILTYFYAGRYFQQYDQKEQDENRRKTRKDWEITMPPRAPAIFPLVYLGWLTYSGLLVVRIAVIFKTFGYGLNGEEFLGTNLLEFVMTGTAGIFALIVAGRSRKPTPTQKVCLKFLQYHVLLEVIDSVEFLTVLFTVEHNLTIPEYVFDMILAFGCMNLILPTLGLYQLSATNFNRRKPRENFYIIQTIISTIFGNMPYLIIRVFLWTDHQYTNALFVMKNIIAIIQNMVELVHYFHDDKAEIVEHRKRMMTQKIALSPHLAVPEDDDLNR